MAIRSTVAKAEAQQVFRQFAWNIAGTLVGKKTSARAVRTPRAGKPRRKPGGKS